MSATSETLTMRLRELKLPSFVTHHATLAREAERAGWSFSSYLQELSELELRERQERKIERLRRSSQLPAEKTLATLDLERFPLPVRRQLPSLCEGAFVERAENLLAFGLPGRGKTHLVCAIGHELVKRGYRVLFVPAYRLVQRLLLAKRNLALPAELRQLDRCDLVILDELGYVPASKAGAELLFDVIATAYERNSLIVTTNLPFENWTEVLGSERLTGAALDRLTHRCHILETKGESYRLQDAKRRRRPTS
ncbi:MAG: ATP-binding protein [Rhodospirillales bacterium]|nr:ATP-binding protein [Rhodospirillales bacterium]